MKRGRQKLNQLAAGVWLVLSLLVSSVAACVCAHHAETPPAAAASCHEHAAPAAEPGMESAVVENVPQIEPAGDCGCSAPAPRIAAKSETIKKHAAAAGGPFAPVRLKFAAAVVSVKTVHFEKPFYLSDSFYSQKSPRAPPAA